MISYEDCSDLNDNLIVATRRLYRATQEEAWLPPWPLRAQAQEGGSWSPQALREGPESLFLSLIFFSILLVYDWFMHYLDFNYLLDGIRHWVSRVRWLPRKTMLRRPSWRKRQYFLSLHMYIYNRCICYCSLLVYF